MKEKKKLENIFYKNKSTKYVPLMKYVKDNFPTHFIAITSVAQFIILMMIFFYPKINTFNCTYSKKIIKTDKFALIDGYTMIIPSYSKRVKVLEKFLNYFSINPPKSLCEIIISWSSDEQQIKNIINKFTSKFSRKSISIYFRIHTDQTVNRRFLDAKNARTNAILSIDDDILINHNDLEFGFRIWKNHSNQIVGYNKRFIKKVDEDGKEKLKYSYWGSKARLIITGVAFLSRDLCLAYYGQNEGECLKLVQKMNNCEDILMNFIAVKLYNLPGIYVNRSYKHLKSRGISTSQKKHIFARSLCLNEFKKSFKKMPLIITNESMFN